MKRASTAVPNLCTHTRTRVSMRIVALTLAMAGMLATGAALAQYAPQETPQDPQALHQEAQRFAETLGQERAEAIGGVAHVTVSQPDARLRLAACAQIEAYQPPGARPVGHTMVGVRCVSGRPWQVFLPADIHVEAPVWMVNQPLPAGHVLAPQDLVQRTQEVLVTEGDNRVLTATDTPPFGATLARAVGAQMVLHANDLHDGSRISAGDSVQVVYAGPGFTVQTDGKSVGAASPGQSVQVRMASGSVVSGVLQQEHTVKVEL